jgi:hypothetical protein
MRHDPEAGADDLARAAIAAMPAPAVTEAMAIRFWREWIDDNDCTPSQVEIDEIRRCICAALSAEEKK